MLRTAGKISRFIGWKNFTSTASRSCVVISVRSQSNLLDTEGLIPPPKPQLSRSEQMRWRPQDHEATSPQCYNTLNLTVQGYDLVVVEKFSQCIHKLMQQNKLKIKEVYALPPEHTTVKHMGPAMNIQNMVTEAELAVYTRVVQVGDMPATLAPILLQILVKDIPPGVTFTAHEYDEEHHLKRFKQNKELITAKIDLEKLWMSR